jgi:hypothetical protein
MKNTPDPIPNGHGLYLLIHARTQSVYVGSSTNLRGRAYEWKAALKRGQFGHPHHEWEFRVVRRTEGLSYRELREAEAQLIESARSAGMNVLNKVAPPIHYRFTVDGIEGSATFHATRLGLNPTKVPDKLRRGYTIEQALGREPSPVHDPRQEHIDAMATKIIHDGRYITIAEAAELLGRSREGLKDTLTKRRKRGPLPEIELHQLR